MTFAVLSSVTLTVVLPMVISSKSDVLKPARVSGSSVDIVAMKTEVMIHTPITTTTKNTVKKGHSVRKGMEARTLVDALRMLIATRMRFIIATVITTSRTVAMDMMPAPHLKYSLLSSEDSRYDEGTDVLELATD